MKRIICLALVLCLVLSLSSCLSWAVSDIIKGGRTNEDDFEIEEIEDDEEETKSSLKEVLVDQNGVKITLKGYNESGSYFGPTFDFLIENDTDKDLSVMTNHVVVNGFMITALLSTEVSAGKKANDSLDVFKSSLDLAEISEINELELSFHIYDGDWNTVFDTELIKITLSDKESTAADGSGDLLYEDGGIKIVAKKLNKDGVLGPAVVLYIENNSGANCTVQVDNMSVNGYMMSGYLSCTVLNGKCAVDEMTIYKSDLEANGIDSVEDLEISFRIFNSDTWRDITKTDPVTLKF